MKKMRLWIHVLLLTTALLLSASIAGKTVAAQAVNPGEIDPTFAQAKMSAAQGGHPVIVQAAKPSEWLSGGRNMWENLTWDILMWNDFIWNNLTSENLTRDIVNWGAPASNQS